MKTFFKKHRIVLFALLAVAGFGVLSGLVMAGAIRLSMRGEQIVTVAEAYAQTPQPVEIPTEAAEGPRISPAEIADIAGQVETRRKSTLPRRSGETGGPYRETAEWDWSQAEGSLRSAALQAADAYTTLLYGQTIEALTGSVTDACSVYRAADVQGYRDPIVRVSDPQRQLLLTMNAKDCALINADLLAFPDGYADADAQRNDALRIVKGLGYRADLTDRTVSRAPEQANVYCFATDTDVCLTLCYFGNLLSQVSVYPSADALYEDVFFAADLRYGERDAAYPEAFTADPEATAGRARNMAQRIERALMRTEIALSGEQTERYTFTFLTDGSGGREDVYRIEGEKTTCLFSAYSHNFIHMTCEIPCSSLKEVPYEEMGGPAYEAAVRDVADALFRPLANGRTVDTVTVNAVYDGIACTMDVVLSDGTLYELRFENGVLLEITYYANESFYMGEAPGWVADSVYVNRATGQPFIPQMPDWDGDLHVKQAPAAED